MMPAGGSAVSVQISFPVAGAQGDDGVPVRQHKEHAASHQRIEVVLLVVSSREAPRDFEARDVAAVDLVQGRVLGQISGTAVIVPGGVFLGGGGEAEN